MTVWGWIMLVLSWTLIVALNVFCFTKVLRGKDGKPQPQK